MAKSNSDKDKKSTAKKKTKQDNLQVKIDELSSSVEKEKNQFLRLFAEFENYKKRTSKERLELFKTASQDLVTALLPVLDDFERALAQIKKSERNDQLQGIELIYQRLTSIHCFSKFDKSYLLSAYL